jgi:hypothetical protein
MGFSLRMHSSYQISGKSSNFFLNRAGRTDVILEYDYEREMTKNSKRLTLSIQTK